MTRNRLVLIDVNGANTITNIICHIIKLNNNNCNNNKTYWRTAIR